MLTELVRSCPDFTPGRWTPCPPLRDRAAWDNLPGYDRWLYGGGEAARRDDGGEQAEVVQVAQRHCSIHGTICC